MLSASAFTSRMTSTTNSSTMLLLLVYLALITTSALGRAGDQGQVRVESRDETRRSFSASNSFPGLTTSSLLTSDGDRAQRRLDNRDRGTGHGLMNPEMMDKSDKHSGHGLKTPEMIYKRDNRTKDGLKILKIIDKRDLKTIHKPNSRVGDGLTTSEVMDKRDLNIMNKGDSSTGHDLKTPESKPSYSNKAAKKGRNSTNRHIGDTFLCHFCVCRYNYEGKTTANCTYYVQSIPEQLPEDLWELRVFKSKIKILDVSYLAIYQTLSKVTFSMNRYIIRIRNSSVENQTLSSVKELDFSENEALSSIDDRSFKIMPFLIALKISLSNLTMINTYTFQGLTQLQALNLSHNKIKHISFDAFDGLRSLRVLDLSGNKQMGYYEKSLPPRLFQSLKHLLYLDIHGFSSPGSLYPNKALLQLSSLQKLTITGLLSDSKFGPEIKALKNFTTLELLGSTYEKCLISNITDSFFENLQNLESFTLEGCDRPRSIRVRNSQLIRNMKTLNIRHSFGYGVHQALNDLQSFQNVSLTSLSLSGLHPAGHGFSCMVLDRDDAKFLKNLNHLEELDLSDNLLLVLTHEFLIQLPRTLKRLDLSGNRLMFHGMSLPALSFMSELVELDLSYQNIDLDQQSSEDEECSRESNCSKNSNHVGGSLPGMNQYSSESFQSTFDQYMWDIASDTELQDDISDGNIQTENSPKQEQIPTHHISVVGTEYPPKLAIVKASYFNGFGIHMLHPDQNNMIREMYLSNSLLNKLNSRVIPLLVRKAVLDSNYISSIGGHFFNNNNSLLQLSLRSNLLGEQFAVDSTGIIFTNLKQLTHLDLSSNIIDKFYVNAFNGLKSLIVLKLSDNKIQSLNASFSYMPSLRVLDLSKNFISWINKTTRDDLDTIATSHTLVVDLTSNPLPCTCEGLELLHWMATSNVYFLHQDFLMCHLENGKTARLGNLKERLQSLQRQCASERFIIVIGVASIVVVGILVGFALMYRFRWKLRYMRNIALAKIVGFRPREAENILYKFDAFFVYADESRNFVLRKCRQELEVNRGHKLCIDDRDFMPGTYIVSDILSAIQNSTKTVVVVTPDFFDADYSEYAIKMAIMEEIHNRRSVLHLCVYQPMPDDDMAQCHDLLMVMNRNDYTEFPPENEANEEIIQNFWDQLSRAIGHTGNEEVNPELEPA